MTPQPWSVQVDDSVGVARQMLAEREIHHLPVLDGDQLVGMVVERDLMRVAHRLGTTVQEVMMPAHRIDLDASLETVLDEMDERHWDAVVVTANTGEVSGIFTAMDAVRVLREVLRRRAA
ncbi:MAG: hypothetical protein JWO36_7167 [Myxococcales bacterium]|nr:hypothetical protein [Myxococcales bacterium]